MRCDDRPSVGETSYSTLTLHEAPNLPDEADVRVELAVVGESRAEWLANILATAAFYVMKERWLAAPGVTFPAVLETYEPSTPLPHLLWVDPFEWPELARVEVAAQRVHWLHGIPIAESERRFLELNGFDAFERLLVDQNVQYGDPERQPLV